MFAEYEAGMTPNPDILCNEEIKFGLFFDTAMAQGFDYVATGHYARVACDEKDCRLLKGADDQKDQSYFLHRMPKEALPRVLFPVGEYTKSEIRRKAKEHGLATADKPDSQGICFVGNLDMHEFLRKKIPAKPGEVVTVDGEVIGAHDGLDACTIGQRHGFHVTKNSRAWYVAEKNREKNELIVVDDREHPLLYKKEALVQDMHWITRPSDEDKVEVAVRYRAEPISATIERVQESSDSRSAFYVLRFAKPVWALAPGQSAVLYKGDICLGGGFLTETSL
jgi:tRNA-specific 2-thiouridylase